MNILQTIANELNIKEQQVENTVKLIDDGNTIPFIARYRKEVTGNLSDEILRDLGERLNYLRNLESRKEEVSRLIEEQGKLTEELKQDIEKAVNKESLKFEDLEITENLLDIKIKSKKGMKVAMENSNFIILNTTLTEDLIKEGIAREIVSKVQNLRKEKDFDIENRIKLYYNSNNYFEEVLKEFGEYIKKETLALKIIKKEDLTNKYNINDIEVYLDVERVEK